MELNRILSDLKAERDRLDRAIAALEGGAGNGRRGRRPGRRGRRVMSAEARRKIGEAMRKRWAERKRKAS